MAKTKTKKEKWTEDEPTLLEIYNKKTPEEKKEFMETASPEELKQLVTDRAKAKIKEGNRKLQELKAKERSEDTRKLILLGALFKKMLSMSMETLNYTISNVEQEIEEIKTNIQVDINELENFKETYTGEDIKEDKEYRSLSRELNKDNKLLKDNEIILTALNTLKEQIAAQTVEDSEQSNESN